MNDIKIANKYLNLYKSAKDRGKEFNLTLTSVKNLLNAKKCYYSGLMLTPETLTIDRINNDKGYIIGNVCACHFKINQLKSNLGKKDILRLAKKLEKIK
jgi:hypothetical protein